MKIVSNIYTILIYFLVVFFQKLTSTQRCNATGDLLGSASFSWKGCCGGLRNKATPLDDWKCDESWSLLFQTDEKTGVWRKIHMSTCINHATHQAMAR